MKQTLPGILMALCMGTAALYGQQEPETDYQRYDLKRKSSELILEGSIKTWNENINGYTLYNVNLGFQGEYTFLTNHTATVKLPYTFAWYNNPDSRNPALYSFGDIKVSYEYLKQFGHINLFFGPRASIPISESNEYAVREGVYSAGGGRYTAGAGVSVTGIRDPVVWNVGFAYDVGLPKEERFYTSLEPGNIQLTCGFTDMLNERFGFSAGLTQYIKLPPLRDGVGKIEELSFSTAGQGEFLVMFEHDYIRFSVEATLYPLNNPFALGITYGHQFVLSKKP